MSVYIIAEIGINHNGNMEIAKKLIQGSKEIGCNAVKFQKRTIDIVYTAEELDKYRESPWGTTNRQQKEGLEFSIEDYKEIDKFCNEIGIDWFFSAWDSNSQKEMLQFNCKYNKVASAMLGEFDFLKDVASEKKKAFISTGMSTMVELKKVIEIFENETCPYELMHCNSTYPMINEDANLSIIKLLKENFKCNVGYSGHEAGRIVSYAACVLGATSLERHVTLDRTMYGSDQAASIELLDFERLIKDIRSIEKIMGNGKKEILSTEKPIREKLRYYSN